MKSEDEDRVMAAADLTGRTGATSFEVGYLHGVSVVTATWQRNDVLLGRCVPSVLVQDWPHEHIIVSDGPDEHLADFAWPSSVRYEQLPVHEPGRHWGHLARARALELACGDFIAYLDDDDAWEPEHLRVLARALLADDEAGFVFSRALVHLTSGVVRIGDGRPAHGRVQTSMLMHRREVLEVAGWGLAHPAEDWELVRSWLDAGIGYVSADAVTVHHYPSVPADPANVSIVSFTPPTQS